MQGGLPDAIELDNTSRASSGGEGNSNNGWDNERWEDPGRDFFEVKRCENGRLGLFSNGEFRKYADADEDSDEFRYCMALALQSMGFMKDPRN
ncbi:hypothetical protein A0H81_06673 [Grifola frondosa]|uniref:Uncharacterized protein n=1 Tax=Grifola frondosa TaxID=5627 RepID=A0A1C7M9T2_GRIFR|nr:hypothetical protein A0H81_06673 [Grifola frondosa]